MGDTFYHCLSLGLKQTKRNSISTYQGLPNNPMDHNIYFFTPFLEDFYLGVPEDNHIYSQRFGKVLRSEHDFRKVKERFMLGLAI
jgi:hypothetical protein